MIKERLLALPGEIKKSKIEIMNKQQGLEDIKSKIRTWELMEVVEITNEVDSGGKTIYSNDTNMQIGRCR